MAAKKLPQLSKFLSFILRHDPGAIGIALDANGWVEIDRLLTACGTHGMAMTRDVFEMIVATSSKQRFAISEDGLRVRANQGHSIEVDLAYEPARPPELLFHGTAGANLAAIQEQGLRKMSRHHVHLSADAGLARMVGMRRGAPIVLTIAAGRMHSAGYVFYLSANGVWLTDRVPPEYIELPERDG
jgi:putative RNA 2'-phosphotransferase